MPDTFATDQDVVVGTQTVRSFEISTGHDPVDVIKIALGVLTEQVEQLERSVHVQSVVIQNATVQLGLARDAADALSLILKEQSVKDAS